MNAAEARTSADNYIDGLNTAHKAWRKKYDAEQARLLTKRKRERWTSLISEIENVVSKRAAQGGRSFVLDEIFYFEKVDAILLPAVKHHFEREGFTVEEFLYDGLMLSWYKTGK
jgi:hypothetical protein